MLRVSFPLAALVLFVSALLGCYPAAGAVPAPITAAGADSAKAQFPASTEASLNAGRDLFASHCNACHSHPDISKIDDKRWPGIIVSMGKKANLDDAQSRSVLEFILVARSQSGPTAGAAPQGN
jgi:cytochrome c5